MPPYLRPQEIKSRYGISRTTAWRWAQNGTLRFPKPARVTNGISLYDVAALDAWFATRAAQSGGVLPANDDKPRKPEQLSLFPMK